MDDKPANPEHILCLLFDIQALLVPHLPKDMQDQYYIQTAKRDIGKCHNKRDNHKHYASTKEYIIENFIHNNNKD